MQLSRKIESSSSGIHALWIGESHCRPRLFFISKVKPNITGETVEVHKGCSLLKTWAHCCRLGYRVCQEGFSALCIIWYRLIRSAAGFQDWSCISHDIDMYLSMHTADDHNFSKCRWSMALHIPYLRMISALVIASCTFTLLLQDIVKFKGSYCAMHYVSLNHKNGQACILVVPSAQDFGVEALPSFSLYSLPQQMNECCYRDLSIHVIASLQICPIMHFTCLNNVSFLNILNLMQQTKQTLHKFAHSGTVLCDYKNLTRYLAFLHMDYGPIAAEAI